MPAARAGLGSICRCVVEAAWPTSVCVPPRLVATHASSSASQNALPAVDAAGDLDRHHAAAPRGRTAAPPPRAADATRAPGTARARPSGCASRNVASAHRVRASGGPCAARASSARAGRATPRTAPSCRRCRSRCRAGARAPSSHVHTTPADQVVVTADVLRRRVQHVVEPVRAPGVHRYGDANVLSTDAGHARVAARARRAPRGRRRSRSGSRSSRCRRAPRPGRAARDRLEVVRVDQRRPRPRSAAGRFVASE